MMKEKNMTFTQNDINIVDKGYLHFFCIVDFFRSESLEIDRGRGNTKIETHGERNVPIGHKG